MVSFIDLQDVNNKIEITNSIGTSLLFDDIIKPSVLLKQRVWLSLSVPGFEHIGEHINDIARQHARFGKLVTGKVSCFSVDKNS